MLSLFYQNIVLKNPKSIFVLLLITLLSFGYFSKDFRLDASSDTLLIEGDPDLEYLKEVTERYGSKEFLILTYSPNEGMVTESSINNLLSLKYKIQSLDWVHSVITLLDIPLLNNLEAPLQERLESFKTLKDEGVDTERGFKEILNSPVFRNFVISEDGKTSGIIVYIKKDELKDIENKSVQEIEDYKDTTKPLDLRVRSYFDINCAHCHFDGGEADVFDLRFSFDQTADPTQMGLGVAAQHYLAGYNGRIVQPGNVGQSILFYRVQTETDNFYMMPPLGRTVRHDLGVQLIQDWINSF